MCTVCPVRFKEVAGKFSAYYVTLSDSLANGDSSPNPRSVDEITTVDNLITVIDPLLQVVLSHTPTVPQYRDDAWPLTQRPLVSKSVISTSCDPLPHVPTASPLCHDINWLTLP